MSTSELKKIFHDPSFKIERFVQFGGKGMANFPDGELLFVAPSGHNSEHLFTAVEEEGLATQIDLGLVPVAARLAQSWVHGCSLNIQAGTAFDPRLIHILQELKRASNFRPDKVVLEVTEQGKIPEDADSGILYQILSMGYRIAVDDIEFDQPDNMARVHQIDGAASIHKFSFKSMAAIRNPETRDDMLHSIATLTDQYNATAVMEGVQGKDQIHFSVMREAGIRAFQFYLPPADQPETGQNSNLPVVYSASRSLALYA